MLQWKGRYRPAVKDHLIHFTDVLPTLVDLCDLQWIVDETRKLDGQSLVGMINGAKLKTPSIPHFWQWNRAQPRYSHNAAMREGDWKLVRPFVTKNYPKGASKLEPILFDLSKDPAETQDLSSEQPKRFARMRAELDAWSKAVEKDRIRTAR